MLRGSRHATAALALLAAKPREIPSRGSVRAPASKMVTTTSAGWPDELFDTRILRADASLTSFGQASTSKHQLPTVQAAGDEAAAESTRQALETAAQELRAGNLVAFPTETVYGLGANATSAEAVAKIYKAKGRPSDNPLIVHVSDREMARSLAADGPVTDSPAYRCLMDAFWPGSMTLLFPMRQVADAKGKQRAVLPDIVSSGLPAVGLRMPSHPLARALIAQAGCPVAAPSSNASGRPSPTTAQHVYYDLGGPLDVALGKAQAPARAGRIRYILDGGPCTVGLESTVVDGITEPRELRILRPGGVTVEQIKQALDARGLLADGANPAAPGAVHVRVYGKDLARDAEQEAKPTTPGMKYKHYSPNARVVLVDAVASAQRNGTANGSAVPSLRQRLDEAAAAGDVGVMAPAGSPLARALSALAPTPAPSPPGAADSRVTAFEMPAASRTGRLFLYDLGALDTPAEGAQRLFAGLRALDEAPHKCGTIFVESMATDQLGLAFMNRIEKAASERVSILL